MDNNNSNPPVDPEDDKPTYEVGYKKPPIHTRFQKGQPGNIKGRPKGVRNKPKDLPTILLNDLIIREGMREITIQEGSKRRKVSIVEATLKSLAMKAVKGDHRSHRLLLELYGIAEKSKTDLKKELFETSVWFKNCALIEITNAKEWGNPEPNILPHPHHIKIDPRTIEVDFIGPITEEEKKEWDKWVARKQIWMEELDLLNQSLQNCTTPKYNKHTRKTIKTVNRLVEIACEFVPDDIFIPSSTIEKLRSEPDIYKFANF